MKDTTLQGVREKRRSETDWGGGEKYEKTRKEQ